MTTATSNQADYLRREFADRLARAGYLDNPRWFDAFRTVPREAFVTAFTVPHRGGQLHHYDLTDPAEAGTALSAVYTDNTLITQVDAGGTATSSSTAPSLMALMLHQLDLKGGHTVLEVGTGTGYNAALLSHFIGAGTSPASTSTRTSSQPRAPRWTPPGTGRTWTSPTGASDTRLEHRTTGSSRPAVSTVSPPRGSSRYRPAARSWSTCRSR